jgi:hypothetical protein
LRKLAVIQGVRSRKLLRLQLIHFVMQSACPDRPVVGRDISLHI